MKGKHIAFCLEQAYGHIIPTLGISLELIRRGHSVSYAVTQRFSNIIREIQARPMIIDPLGTREALLGAVINDHDPLNYKVDAVDIARIYEKLRTERTADSLTQLECLYRDERPDVIIHDDNLDTAGRSLASKWNIAKIRHVPQFIDERMPLELFSEDELILLTVPEFFQGDMAQFDQRFKFVGFIPEGRTEVFQPWKNSRRTRKPILISATTGLLPQFDFCELMIEAFRDRPWDVVLSPSGSLDAISAIDPGRFAHIPSNIQLNTDSANFAVLEYSCLSIGHGGQGTILEAIFWGVPQILFPPTPFHYTIAKRANDLGLGYCLPKSDLTADSVIRHVTSILNDKDTFDRVADASRSMRNNRGAEVAVDTIETYLAGSH